MEATEQKISWTEANQAYLSAEFARLKDRLSTNSQGHTTEAIEKTRDQLESPPAIDRISDVLGLSSFERDLLLLCAGVEMDSKLAILCGETQGRPQRTNATFGLAMAVLPEPHWSALTPFRPLRRLHLVEPETGHTLTSAPLRINERVLHYLAGINLLDPHLQPILRLSPDPVWIADGHKSVAAETAHFVESHPDWLPIVHFCGDDPEGQEDTAAMAASQLGLQLFVLAAECLPAAGSETEEFIGLWERESVLLQGALLIQIGSGELTASARRLIERLPGLVFLASRGPIYLKRPPLRFDIDKPQPVEQRRLWTSSLGSAAANFNGALDELSEQFRFSAKTIFSTGNLLGRENDALRPEQVWKACRSLSRPKLENLAQRIIPCANWDDLVLPEVQEQTLHALASQVRHRMKVYETWGFSARGRHGLGVSALFTGESGTGKTLAAEVLARDLGLDLYRIDLSAVVSKYIGETEKNLRQIFDAAEEGGALLLFDEADALFGKRSEVKDSHDRYANIEVSYLLQRMEAYEGLAILTTNLKSSMDRAFQRRIRFTVNFPFPDAELREAIWRRIFPAQTPTRGLGYKKLAQLNIAGGNIRNIALNAAFLAAENGRAVEMADLLQAARLETQKIERPLSDAEIRGWTWAA
jgi:SpoVK/Ycf46/Vps4 family AAA+-type ATPase